MKGVWIFKTNRPNVSRFETDDRREARLVKEVLDRTKTHYAVCVTSTKNVLIRKQEWKVVFNIYGRQGNTDLLKLMFELQKEGD